MPKLNTYKVFQPEPDFLAFPDHYVNITAKIAFADLDGLKEEVEHEPTKRVIPRGKVVNLAADGTITAADGEGNAIIFNTIDIDDYDEVDEFVNATVLVHGFVRADRLFGTVNAPLIHVVEM